MANDANTTLLPGGSGGSGAIGIALAMATTVGFVGDNLVGVEDGDGQGDDGIKAQPRGHRELAVGPAKACRLLHQASEPTGNVTSPPASVLWQMRTPSIRYAWFVRLQPLPTESSASAE